MYSLKHLTTIISLIILLTAMSGQVDAADEAMLKTICNQSTDYNFCMKTFKDDPLTRRADVDDLALLSINHTINKAQETANKLRAMKVGDPCLSDYLSARDEFNEVYKTVSPQDYLEALREVQVAKSLVEDCRGVITDDYHTVEKLQEIIQIILEILGSTE